MAAVWLALSAVGFWLLGFSAGVAVLGGLADFWRQLGHALAARRLPYDRAALLGHL